MHKRVFRYGLTAPVAVFLAAFSLNAAATDTLRCVPGVMPTAPGKAPAGIAAENENLIVLEVDVASKSVRLQKSPWAGPPLLVQSWTDDNIRLQQRQNRPIQERFFVQQTLTFNLDRSTGVLKMTPSFASPEGRPMSNTDVLGKLKEYGIRPQFASLPMEPVTALCSPVQKIF